MDNFLYIPLINPIKFYDDAIVASDKYQTKHFDDYNFENRLLPWQQPETFQNIWQTTDIIKFRFYSTFDPIIVRLLNEAGDAVITLPTLIGLPNKYQANSWAFSADMSLAGLETSCYKVQVVSGTGDAQKTYTSDCQYISSTPIPNTLMLEYRNSRYHQDVLFEDGTVFQYRVFGHYGFLNPGKSDEFYRDQVNNPALLNSRTRRLWPFYFGNEFGITDDVIDLLNRIWSCDTVMIDGKLFGVSDDSKLEFTDEEYYPKRGVTLLLEEGINRNSRIFAVTTDTNKKLMVNVNVESLVFGDLANAGSNNTIPVTNTVIE